MSGRTGEFRPRLIRSALPISLSKKKEKDKNKTMESQFKPLAFHREKLRFALLVSMNLKDTRHC